MTTSTIRAPRMNGVKPPPADRRLAQSHEALLLASASPPAARSPRCPPWPSH
jgi:hypothetical protein